MKALFIAGIVAIALSGCNEAEHQASRTADSTLITDTMPVLRPESRGGEMPVIPLDTSGSEMPVVRPADSIMPK